MTESKTEISKQNELHCVINEILGFLAYLLRNERVYLFCVAYSEEKLKKSLSDAFKEVNNPMDFSLSAWEEKYGSSIFPFQYGNFTSYVYVLGTNEVNVSNYMRADEKDAFFESVDNLCEHFVKERINVSRLASELNSLLQAFCLTKYFDRPSFTTSEVSNKKIADQVCAERELLHGVQNLLFQEMFKMLNGRCQDFLLSSKEEPVSDETIEQKVIERVGESVSA